MMLPRKVAEKREKIRQPPEAPNLTGNRGLGGEPCWVRTSDLLIKSQLLYQLS